VLVRLAGQVGDIDQEVSAITAATQRQASALREVDAALARMEQVSQQTAAMVETVSAASQELAGEVRQLAGVSERFEVNAAAPKPPRAPAARSFALAE
jgi:methyl-accepting chemotaxis protein